MNGNPSAPANFAEAINRSLNLVAATVLGLTAIAFGSDLFAEAESIDKVDDTLLAVVGLIAVLGYFTGRHWAMRSPVPVILAALALAIQAIGVVLEMGDPNAIGDDIPGMIVYVPLLIVLAILYSVHGQYLATAPSAAVANPPGAGTAGR